LDSSVEPPEIASEGVKSQHGTRDLFHESRGTERPRSLESVHEQALSVREAAYVCKEQARVILGGHAGHEPSALGEKFDKLQQFLDSALRAQERIGDREAKSGTEVEPGVLDSARCLRRCQEALSGFRNCP